MQKLSLKIILVGSTGVGKTSLISVYTDDRFERQAVSTVAPASCSSVVPLEDGRNVELQIWDTAGQERFQSISQMFYRDSQVAFVCYDTTTEETVENWIAKVREEVPQVIVFLVSTKCDQLSNEEMAECLAKGKEMCEKFRAKAHVVTSAKKGMGVKELFKEAAKCSEIIFAQNEQVVSLSNREEKSSCC